MNGKDFYELYQAHWNETHEPNERISKLKAEDYCRTMLDLLNEQIDELKVGERITFYGFGTFTRKMKPAHVIGDLKTGGRMELPEREKVVFLRSDTKN